MKISGIRTEMPRLSTQDLESSRNRNWVLSLAVPEPESESSSKPVQSRNRTRNRVLPMDSLRIGIGTKFLDWTVSEPESESKKLGTSGGYYHVLFLRRHCFVRIPGSPTTPWSSPTSTLSGVTEPGSSTEYPWQTPRGSSTSSLTSSGKAECQWH